MFQDKTLMEAYSQLKNLEKVVELNLGVLEELEETLFDNIEEISEFLQIMDGDKRIFLSKVRSNLRTLLKHITHLREKLEREWELLEFRILKLVISQDIPEIELIKKRTIYDLQERLELLKDFIDIQWSLFGEDLKKYNLHQKFPAEVYISFFEKISEFNKQI